MAARNNPLQNEACREKIQTTQLINRLQKHVFTHTEADDFKMSYMDKSQVSAAVALLKKTLPDLSNVELTGEGGGAVQFGIAVKYD